MGKIQYMLETRVKKLEWMPKAFNRDFNQNAFLESVDRLYLLHYASMQEVVYTLDLVQQREIGETVRVVFAGLRYIFEALTDSYVQKTEELLEVNNSTRIRYIEHPDKPLKLEVTLSEMESLRNKRAIQLDEEDALRKNANLISEDVKGSFAGIEALLSMNKKNAGSYELNFGDAEEEAQRELKEKERIKNAVLEIRKAMEKGLPVDYYAIPDPKIILELNNQIFDQMLFESQKQQEKLRKSIMDYEGHNNVDLKTPGELHRLIVMNTKIVESLDLNKLELAMPHNFTDDPDNYFKATEFELYKSFNEKQRQLMAKVIEIMRRGMEKTTSSKMMMTVTTAKDIDSLWYSSSSMAGTKESKKELASALAENEKLTGRLEKSKAEVEELQKIVKAKDKLLMSLADNIEELKKLQRVKTPEDLSKDTFRSNPKVNDKKHLDFENEVEDLENKLQKNLAVLENKSKELESVKKRNDAMYQALEQVRKVASKQGVLRVGSMSDIQVITKIEQILTTLEDKIKQQEEEIQNNTVDDSLMLDIGNGKKVLKPVRMKHAATDAKGQPFKINDDSVHERESFASRSALNHGMDQKYFPSTSDLISQKPTDDLKKLKEEKKPNLKISVVTIAIISPKKSQTSTVPGSKTNIKPNDSTKNLDSSKGEIPKEATKGKSTKDLKASNRSLDQRGKGTIINQSKGKDAKRSNDTQSKPSQPSVKQTEKLQNRDMKNDNSNVGRIHHVDQGMRDNTSKTVHGDAKPDADDNGDDHSDKKHQQPQDSILEHHETDEFVKSTYKDNKVDRPEGQTKQTLNIELNTKKDPIKESTPVPKKADDPNPNPSNTKTLQPPSPVKPRSSQKTRPSNQSSFIQPPNPTSKFDFFALESLMSSLKAHESLVVRCELTSTRASIVADTVAAAWEAQNGGNHNKSRSTSIGVPAAKDQHTSKSTSTNALPTIREASAGKHATLLDNKATRRVLPNSDRVYVGNSSRKIIDNVFSHKQSVGDSANTTAVNHNFSAEIDSKIQRFHSEARETNELGTSYTLNKQRVPRYIKISENEGPTHSTVSHRRNISTYVPQKEGEFAYVKKSNSSRRIDKASQPARENEHVAWTVEGAKKQSQRAMRRADERSLADVQRSQPSLEDASGGRLHNNSSVISSSQQGAYPQEYQVYVPREGQMVPDEVNILVEGRHSDENFLEELYAGMNKNIGDSMVIGHQIKLPTLKQFKAEVKEFAEQHAGCGPKCAHLQRFYERCGIGLFNKPVPTYKQPYIFPVVDLIKKVSKSELELNVALADHQARRKADIVKNLAKKPVFI
jgi:hypothetical protein